MGLNIYERQAIAAPQLNDTFLVKIKWNKSDTEYEELPSCIGFTAPMPKWKEELQTFGNNSYKFLIPDYDSVDDVQLEFLEYADLRISDKIAKMLSYVFNFEEDKWWYLERNIYELVVEIYNNNFSNVSYTYVFKYLKITKYDNYELNYSDDTPVKWNISLNFMHYQQYAGGYNVSSLATDSYDFNYDSENAAAASLPPTPIDLAALSTPNSGFTSSMLSGSALSAASYVPPYSGTALPTTGVSEVQGSVSGQPVVPENPPADAIGINPTGVDYSKMDVSAYLNQKDYTEKEIKTLFSSKSMQGKGKGATEQAALYDKNSEAYKASYNGSLQSVYRTFSNIAFNDNRSDSTFNVKNRQMVKNNLENKTSWINMGFGEKPLTIGEQKAILVQKYHLTNDDFSSASKLMKAMHEAELANRKNGGKEGEIWDTTYACSLGSSWANYMTTWDDHEVIPQNMGMNAVVDFIELSKQKGYIEVSEQKVSGKSKNDLQQKLKDMQDRGELKADSLIHVGAHEVTVNDPYTDSNGKYIRSTSDHAQEAFIPGSYKDTSCVVRTITYKKGPRAQTTATPPNPVPSPLPLAATEQLLAENQASESAAPTPVPVPAPTPAPTSAPTTEEPKKEEKKEEKPKEEKKPETKPASGGPLAATEKLLEEKPAPQPPAKVTAPAPEKPKAKEKPKEEKPKPKEAPAKAVEPPAPKKEEKKEEKPKEKKLKEEKKQDAPAPVKKVEPAPAAPAAKQQAPSFGASKVVEDTEGNKQLKKADGSTIYKTKAGNYYTQDANGSLWKKDGDKERTVEKVEGKRTYKNLDGSETEYNVIYAKDSKTGSKELISMLPVAPKKAPEAVPVQSQKTAEKKYETPESKAEYLAVETAKKDIAAGTYKDQKGENYMYGYTAAAKYNITGLYTKLYTDYMNKNAPEKPKQ